ETPANRFVAGFVGDSTQLEGTVGQSGGGHCELVLPTGERLKGLDVNGVKVGRSAVASVRPERIEAHFDAPRELDNTLPAKVSGVIYFGDHQRLRCEVAGQALATVKLPLAAGVQPAAGQAVWLRIATPHLRVYA
ncbi:MAG: TOBE domain-containing protein, partial [Rubrivivax sp.]|nr:TOBE domain-containing protein [Rubrivivax sp.]